MRAIIQRVQSASVGVDGRVVGTIERGILTLLGVAAGDTSDHVAKLIEKISKLRIFEDESGKMNKSLIEMGGSHLIVSQFTLFADCTKGNRPSFIGAGPVELAKQLYLEALEKSKSLGIRTEGGIFQANMQVSLVNDGPVTISLDI